MKQGDTIDFVVDCGRATTSNYDAFDWTPTITQARRRRRRRRRHRRYVELRRRVRAAPAAKPPTPLNAVGEVRPGAAAESNEFVFVD